MLLVRIFVRVYSTRVAGSDVLKFKAFHAGVTTSTLQKRVLVTRLLYYRFPVSDKPDGYSDS